MCRSKPITFRPLSNALGGFRSAIPRAAWYANRNPNQMASCLAKSPHPRGSTRRPTAASVVIARLVDSKRPTGPRKFPRLAPDLAHRPRGSHKTGVVDLVLELLVGDRETDQLFEPLVREAVSERCLQIPLAAREEAGAQLSVGGQPDPVARRAERLRNRVDEADLAGAVGEAEAPRSRRRLRRQLLERPALLDQRPDLAAGQDVVAAPGLICVERHELDKADDVGLAARELGEGRHLLLGEPPDRDAVDLDRAKLW